MNSISWRAQLGLVALGYGAVLVVAATLLFGRHLQELQNPAEASGGMWAAGDAFLMFFIGCLFMVPTVFLIWVTAKFEAFYTAYSKFLVGLSLSAPVCLSVLYLGENHVGQGLIDFSLYRLVCLPFILVGMGIIRLVARFDRAKRFVSYALLIEGLTLAMAVALLIHGVDPKAIDGNRPAAYPQAVLLVSSKCVIQIFRRPRWISPDQRDDRKSGFHRLRRASARPSTYHDLAIGVCFGRRYKWTGRNSV